MIVLVVAQKAYVLNATLGVLHLERRLWMLWTSDIHVSDDYTIVQCKILNGLEARRRRRFETSRNISDVLKRWNCDFMLVPLLRGTRPPTRFFVHKVKEKSSIVERVLRLSEYHNRLNRVGVNLPDEIVMVLHSHCHQAIRASWWTITYQG